jgi:SET domain-containing protein
MKEKTRNTLTVMWSTIHGRGLYTRRSIEKGELIIEYAGEVSLIDAVSLTSMRSVLLSILIVNLYF